LSFIKENGGACTDKLLRRARDARERARTRPPEL